MTKETFWFRHDYDAADDDKTMLLIEQLGLEGYGIYWILIEKLRGRKDYKMPFSVVPSLARRYMTTPEKMKTVITQYGLFEYDDDGFFYSVSLIERMTALEDLKNKRSIAGKIGNEKRWKKESETQQLELFIANESQCDSNAIASYRDKNRIEKNIIKEKEDKSSKKKNFVPPTIEEVAEYIKEKGYHFSAESFWCFYESKGWMVGKNKMKIWKAACATWESKYKEQLPVSSNEPVQNKNNTIINGQIYR